ncbi:hypothetical protein DP187_21765 [Enterobacter cloacae]|nr:hypothetical protein DP187_21765 [Enterobacter cloacae]
MMRGLFLFAIFINGAGSSILAVGYPYSFLTTHTNMTYYFISMGVVFFLTAIGALLWGYKIDHSTNIWDFRLKILAVEFLATFLLLMLLMAGITFHPLALLIFIALLEFLFAYEIPWSRVAWNDLNKWGVTRGWKKINPAMYIVITTSLISAVGPGIGAFLGAINNIKLLVAIKLISLIPYYFVCIKIIQIKKEKNNVHVRNSTNTTTLAFFFRQPPYQTLTACVILTLLANAFLIVSLPVEVTKSITTINNIWLVFFYLFSATIPVASTALLRKLKWDVLPQRHPVTIFIAMLLFGFLFFFTEIFYYKCLFYLLYNVAAIWFNTLLTDIIYQKKFEKQQGRLFSLIQVTTNFSFPLAAVIMAFTPESFQMILPIISFSVLSVLAVVIYLLT